MAHGHGNLLTLGCCTSWSKVGQATHQNTDVKVPPMPYVMHQWGISCNVQVLGMKSYQDFSSGIHKDWLSRAQDQCKWDSFDD